MPSSLDQASISPRSNGGPTYDQAYLNQLKASTPTSRPTLPGNDSYDADMSMDVDMSMDSVESLDVFGGKSIRLSHSFILNFIAFQRWRCTWNRHSIRVIHKSCEREKRANTGHWS